MLLDALGSLFLLSSSSVDQFTQSLHLVAPGAIPIWAQYVDFIEWSLTSLSNIFQNGGLAIIAFTVIVKTLILPLTVKSIRSSKAMQELAPKIKELQKKHGGDRQKASAETMALYQAHGVNPMSGCLPMIVQIPIFFGLYRGIVNLSGGGTGHFADGFLWLNDLSKADPWHVLPIAAGVFQFVQSRMMRPAGQKVTDPQQQIMNTMMNFMPLMVVVFGWTFAAGPVIYWATQSVYSVLQQWFITGWGDLKTWLPWLPEMPEHRRLGYRPPRDLDDVVVVSGQPVEQKGIGGWFQKRMMEAQKNAEARQEAARQTKGGAKSTTRAAAPADAAIEAEGEDVTAPAPPSKRKGSSYQNRVDAATKFGAARTATATAPSGNGSGSTGTANGRTRSTAQRSTRPKKKRSS